MQEIVGSSFTRRREQEVIVKIFVGGQFFSGFSLGYQIKTIFLPCGFYYATCLQHAGEKELKKVNGQ